MRCSARSSTSSRAEEEWWWLQRRARLHAHATGRTTAAASASTYEAASKAIGSCRYERRSDMSGHGESTGQIIQSLLVNVAIAAVKAVAAVLTKSGSMLAEALHTTA